MILYTKVEEIMTKDVFSVELDDTIHKADEIMREESVRQVPVIDENKLIGLITERTLMEYSLRQLYDFDDEFGEIGYNKINDFQDVMAKNVRIIYPEDSLHKALELMAKYKTDCLPVVDWNNNLVGIITSIDILLFFRNKLSEK
ncbi:MAG: CBS domain-containing protein [Ignavibacteria bacterium]|jgi:acetoin utilization protein AcuB|nr:CBS domain-containing protein [Ignavibacteria bacterium]